MTSCFKFISTGPKIQIGEFTVRQLGDGSIWIENESGEGMQAQVCDMEPLIKEFFRENF